jgi:Ca2+-binding EF-hand superfamily protein
MARAMHLLTQMNYFPDSDEENENGEIAGGYLVARTKKKKKKKGSRKEEPEDEDDDEGEEAREENKDDGNDDDDGEKTDEDSPKIERPLVETPPENATSPLRLRTTSSAVASSLFADSPTSAQPQMKSTLQRHDSVANFSYRVPSDDESSVDDRAEETCSLSEFAVLLNVAFWDENADGRITEREVRFNVGRLRSVGVDTMAIEALLDKARQENADVSVGTLSKVLHNAHANVAQAMTVFAHFDQHAVLHATHILDEMDTGYVTVDSVKTVMKRLGVKSSEADIVAMMAQADTSGNGKVKTKEFTRLLATELKVLREQQTKDMSSFELGSDGVVGEMDDFEDGSVHSNLSSSDTIELAEKVLLKSALKMQKDAQDKLMQRGKKGGGKNNKNNSEDSKDQQSAETGALAEETYELSIEEYKVERHGSVLAAKREMLRVPSFGVLKNFPSSRKDRDISVKKGEVTMKKSITWSDTDTLETYCLYDRQTGDMMFVSEDGERTSLPMRDDYFTGRTRSIAAAKAARDADRNPSCCSIM